MKLSMDCVKCTFMIIVKPTKQREDEKNGGRKLKVN
jgi:hypothetical protein